MDAPLDVKVIVYDLLPPSRLASLLNLVGTGVYHSSVQLTLPLGPTDSDPTPLEYAFGGHDSPNVTGVFSIPAESAPQRMPGLRHYRTIDVGTAFGPEWRKLNGRDHEAKRQDNDGARKLRKHASTASLLGDAQRPSQGTSVRTADDDETTLAGPRYPGLADASSSVASFETLSHSPVDGQVGDDDGGVSDGIEYMTRDQRRAWRIIQELKRDPAWNGTRYDLLKRNCNSFTEELVRRLTGRTVPAWINRAAYVATSIPCIVPAGWIDETEDAAPTADSTAAQSASIDDPAHLASTNGNVRIEPPRADRMDLGGRT
ncbi:hypothetical protein JCM10212_006981 [Sporobolomyces blumeae]